MALTEYQKSSYYQINLEEGREYQDFVLDKFLNIGMAIVGYSSYKYQKEKGETSAGIEIKYDKKFKDTKNLYIEYGEKDPKAKEYVRSGILREDNTWLYAIGDYKTIFIFSKRLLKVLLKSEITKNKHVSTMTSQGYLLREDIAFKYADKVIQC